MKAASEAGFEGKTPGPLFHVAFERDRLQGSATIRETASSTYNSNSMWHCPPHTLRCGLFESYRVVHPSISPRDASLAQCVQLSPTGPQRRTNYATVARSVSCEQGGTDLVEVTPQAVCGRVELRLKSEVTQKMVKRTYDQMNAFEDHVRAVKERPSVS